MTSAIATMMTVPNDSATGNHERDARPFAGAACGGWNTPTSLGGRGASGSRHRGGRGGRRRRAYAAAAAGAAGGAVAQWPG